MNTLEYTKHSEPGHMPHDDIAIQNTVKEKSRVVAESVSAFAEKAKDKSSTFVDEKTTTLGNALDTANKKGELLKNTIEEKYQNTLSPRIESAQKHISEASSYLQTRRTEDFVADLADLGRRHPKVAFGTLIVAGFVLAKILPPFVRKNK